MKEWKNKREIITRKIQNSFLIRIIMFQLCGIIISVRLIELPLYKRIDRMFNIFSHKFWIYGVCITAILPVRVVFRKNHVILPNEAGKRVNIIVERLGKSDD
ncbi:hypothetical protein [Proteiniphilum sp. X52]|uniref:hypothetical protein n=1 Tax=Proteiniphilum sp. X52 TaxID=2382159 RepID=UPI000F0A160E|nr:hypothetical protein [Proteiniphilum sp. X52]RNC64370.1 hypothetical protein D7D25_11695 [Proteiniphilum sp. X52]